MCKVIYVVNTTNTEHTNMSSSFAQLKNNRKDQLEKLTASLKQNTTPESREDDRFWKPTIDKAGNGYAIIRFLPPPKGEDMPYVSFWDHGFQGPGGWYIEKSLTTLKQKDPVSEYNTQLWNSGVDENKEIARKQKRRLHYVANIYVVKDPAKPETEGKVYLYQFGKKIFDKISSLVDPEFEDESATDVFNLWEGANFKLKIRKVEGYPNYDKSEFDKPSALSDDDDELEKIWEKEYPLNTFLDPSNFKSYDELKKRLHKVLGWDASSFDEQKSFTKSAEEISAPKQKEMKQKPQRSDEVSYDEYEEEGLDFFKKMVEED